MIDSGTRVLTPTSPKPTFFFQSRDSRDTSDGHPTLRPSLIVRTLENLPSINARLRSLFGSIVGRFYLRIVPKSKHLALLVPFPQAIQHLLIIQITQGSGSQIMLDLSFKAIPSV